MNKNETPRASFFGDFDSVPCSAQRIHHALVCQQACNVALFAIDGLDEVAYRSATFTCLRK